MGIQTMIGRFIILAIVMFTQAICAAKLAILDEKGRDNSGLTMDFCESIEGWQTHNGSEFKGPLPTVDISATAKSGIAVSWDFSKGGYYVVARRNCMLSPSASELFSVLSSTKAVSLSMRLQDGAGRHFQTHSVMIPAGEKVTIRLDFGGSYKERWGKGDHMVPKDGIQQIGYVLSPVEVGDAGVLTLHKMILEDAQSALPFVGENFALSSSEWKVTGLCESQYNKLKWLINTKIFMIK